MKQYPSIFDYFVYRHIRLDTNKVFYVGRGRTFKRKGVNRERSIVDLYWRAYSKSKRTFWWNNIVSKVGYEVEIMYESDDFNEICEKEKEFIKLYGRKDLGLGELVNMSDGGDGNPGFSDESKKLIVKTNIERGNYDKFRDARVLPVVVYSTDGKFIKHCKDRYECAKFLKCSPSTINNYLYYKTSLNDCILSRELNLSGIDISGYKIYRPKAIGVEKVINGEVVCVYKNRKEAIENYDGNITNICRSIKTGKEVKGILWRKIKQWYSNDVNNT